MEFLIICSTIKDTICGELEGIAWWSTARNHHASYFGGRGGGGGRYKRRRSRPPDLGRHFSFSLSGIYIVKCGAPGTSNEVVLIPGYLYCPARGECGHSESRLKNQQGVGRQCFPRPASLFPLLVCNCATTLKEKFTQFVSIFFPLPRYLPVVDLQKN